MSAFDGEQMAESDVLRSGSCAAIPSITVFGRTMPSAGLSMPLSAFQRKMVGQIGIISS